MEKQHPSDRRNDSRAPGTGSAYVFSESGAFGPYSVGNLSAGGALLSGGPVLRVQTELRVRLEFADMEPIELEALVVRSHLSARAHVFALQFLHREGDTEDLIQEVVLSALEAIGRARQHA